MPEQEGDDPALHQSRFEAAALAVLALVLETGRRIDLVAEDYLTRFPVPSREFHLRADLIICVADCHGLMVRAAGSVAQAGRRMDAVRKAWETAAHAPRIAPHDGITRIQAAIGNIRKAIKEAAECPS